MANAEKSDREIFDAVMAIEDSEQRADVLRHECADNPDQLARVQALLEALDEADGFMETRDHAPGTTRNPVATPIVGIEERPGSVIGNYKLLQEIGAGGFGVVYMAEQLRPVKRKVALKIIKPGMDTREVVARFEAERQALALMSHPNIAQVFDGGATASGRPYFVMELVKGIPITEFCDKSKLSTKRRLNLFLDICSAIQHAHQKGVIHRDIKPSNVLITLHDGVPVPKVIDFGIAKALNQELTEKSLFTAYGQMIGTPQYTSPEQAEMSGLDIDTRSDIYSLGILLYELLTGETPISRLEVKQAGLQEVQRLIKDKEPTKPSLALSIMCRESTTVADFRRADASRLIDQIQGDLDWIVLKALEKDRTRRYETATGFADDIRHFLNHEPVTASPPTVRYLAGKYWRRNRKPLTAVLAIFVALLGGVIGMTALYFRAKTAENEAVLERESTMAQSVRAESEKVRAQQARDSEVEQRKIADASVKRLRRSMAQSDFDAGSKLLDAGDSGKALAYLARSLRMDPTHPPTAPLIISALRDRNHVLKQHSELRSDEPIDIMRLNQPQDRLFTVTRGGIGELWNTDPVGKIRRFEDAESVHGFAFSKDGRHLVIWRTNGTVRVWNTVDGQAAGPEIKPTEALKEVKVATPTEGGLSIATLSPNLGIRVWNAFNGRPLTPVLRPEAKTKRAFVFGENAELVGGRFDRQWMIWNLEKKPPQLVKFRDTRMRTSFYSLRHRILVEGAYDSDHFVTYDMLTGKERHRIPLEGAPYRSPEWLGDGRRVVVFAKTSDEDSSSSSASGTTRATLIFDAVSGKVLTRNKVNSNIMSPLVDPSGRRVLYSVSGERLVVCSLTTGKTIKVIRQPLLNKSQSFKFSPKGEWFALASVRSVSIYRSSNGSRVCRTPEFTEEPKQVFFSPSGRYFATTMASGKLRIWETQTGLAASDVLKHSAFAGAVQFDHDERRVFSTDSYSVVDHLAYGTVRIWSLDPTKASYRLALKEEAVHATFGPRGHLIAVTLKNGSVRLIDRRTGEMVGPVRAPGSGKVLLVDISPDGKKLAAITRKKLLVWDLSSFNQNSQPDFEVAPTPDPTGRPASLERPRDASMGLVRFSPDGKWIATVHRGQLIGIWHARTGTQATATSTLDRWAQDLAFRPDNAQLMIMTRWHTHLCDLRNLPARPHLTNLSRGPRRWKTQYRADGTEILSTSLTEAIIWNADDLSEILKIPVGSSIRDSALSPDATKILTAIPNAAISRNVPGSVILWDRRTGRRLAEMRHAEQIRHTVFSPDGKQIITSYHDDKLRAWDVATASPTTLLFPHASNLSFEVSPDSRSVLCVARGQVRLFPLPTYSRPPDWLPDLAEAVAGQRLDEDGHIRTHNGMSDIRTRLRDLDGSGKYQRFARWFLQDPMTKPPCPDPVSALYLRSDP